MSDEARAINIEHVLHGLRLAYDEATSVRHALNTISDPVADRVAAEVRDAGTLLTLELHSVLERFVCPRWGEFSPEVRNAARMAGLGDGSGTLEDAT